MISRSCGTDHLHSEPDIDLLGRVSFLSPTGKAATASTISMPALSATSNAEGGVSRLPSSEVSGPRSNAPTVHPGGTPSQNLEETTGHCMGSSLVTRLSEWPAEVFRTSDRQSSSPPRSMVDAITTGFSPLGPQPWKMSSSAGIFFGHPGAGLQFVEEMVGIELNPGAPRLSSSWVMSRIPNDYRCDGSRRRLPTPGLAGLGCSPAPAAPFAPGLLWQSPVVFDQRSASSGVAPAGCSHCCRLNEAFPVSMPAARDSNSTTRVVFVKK